MNHPELDELLAVVRDDAVAEDVRRHLDECEQCAADVASVVRLDAAAELIGTTRVPGGSVVPASSVWDRIQAELATEGPVAAAEPAEPRRARRSVVVAVAAAVAGIVIGGLGGFLLTDDGPVSPDRNGPGAGVPIAVGTLVPEGRSSVSGEAQMSQDDSSRSLTVTFSEIVPGPGYVEAWLLDPATNEMLALGVLDPEGGTVTIPPDADLSRFTTVDISREPYDGDPAHSAESLARGVLQLL